MADMATKRTALASALLTVLQTTDADYAVDERLRDVTVKGSTRRDRVRVMGDPVRYAVVNHVGREYPAAGDVTDLAGRPLDAIDVFSIQVWHAWDDSDTYSSSSQAAWDTLTAGAAGVFATLVGDEWLDNAGALGLPQNVQLDLVALDDAGQDLAHYLSFTISVA